MADIVLRNRDGKEINYPGVNYIKVNKADGKTQGYAAYDPETLVPENLVSGVVVGDVEGALKVPQAVETTIDPDFSAGDMEVVPEDGQVFSKVGILKPANLLPENIAKDVNIGGVLGTLESGGGGKSPLLFTVTRGYFMYAYTSSSASAQTRSVSVDIPLNAIVHNCGLYFTSNYKTSSSTAMTFYPQANYRALETFEVIEGTSAKTVKYSAASTYGKYYTLCELIAVVYSLPGVYLQERSGELVMYADETVTEIPSNIYYSLYANVKVVDLSGSNIKKIGSFTFQNRPASLFLFPSTVNQIYDGAFSNVSACFDFSKSTGVPYLETADAFTKSDNLEIRVPAALYDKWIAASGWSTLADYIVAV